MNEVKSNSAEEKNQTETVEPETTKPQEHKNKGGGNKLPLLIIVILLVLLVPLGGYFLMNEASKAKVTPTPTEAPATETKETVIPTKAVSPTSSTSIKLDKSFTSAKFPDLSFSGYKLMYPSDWTLSEQRDTTVSPVSRVTLIKQGYALKIFQGATGGAMCVYKDPMPEGPAGDFRNSKFVDITISFATLRQTESPSNGLMNYTYCQKSTSDNSFGQPTSVGHMSVTTGVANPDPAIIKEIEAIIESIELLK